MIVMHATVYLCARLTAENLHTCSGAMTSERPAMPSAYREPGDTAEDCTSEDTA